MPGTPVLVRYADDLVVCCHSRQQAEQVKARLGRMAGAPGSGLQRGQDPDRAPRPTGFEFLGFNVRRYRNGKLLIKPSTAAIRRLRKRLATEMRALRGSNAGRSSPAQPDHPGLGRLLPGSGVQQDLLQAGRLRVEAHLQVGQTQPPQQAEDLGGRPLLRQVQQVCRAPRWMRTKTTGWVSTAVRGARSGSRAWWPRWRCDRRVVAAVGGPGRMAAVVDTMSRDLGAPCPGTAVVDQPAGAEVNSLPPVIRLISGQPRSAASAPLGSASRSPRCT